MKKKGRYLIAFVLKDEQSVAVDHLRQTIASTFDVAAAMRLPPHMTLFYPFETDDISKLAAKLEKIAASQKAFTVPINKFSSFDERVWFLDPAQDEKLFILKDAIVSIIKGTLSIGEDNEGRKAHFHITLAYKDLTPEKHRVIGEYLSKKMLPVKEVLIDNFSILSWEEKTNTWTAMRVFNFPK